MEVVLDLYRLMDIEGTVRTVFSLPSPLFVAVLVVVLMFLNSSIMIPPSEYICVAAGMYAVAHDINPSTFVALAIISNHLGTTLWYLVGLRDAKSSMTPIWKRVQNYRERWWYIFAYTYTAWMPVLVRSFREQGWLRVVLIRLVPVARSIASYPAGCSRMSHIAFSTSSICGISIWVMIWTGLGYLFGDFAFQYTIAVAVSVGAVSLVLFYFAKHIFSGSEEL